MKLPVRPHTLATRLVVLAAAAILVAAIGPSAALAGKTGGSGGPQFPPDPGLICGADIDHSLQMTRNYDCGNGFRVTASGITVDLAGYTVRVTNGGQQAFRIEGSKVTIKNGTIVTDRRDYNSRGVQLASDRDVTLSRLTFTVAHGNYGVVCDEGVGSLSMSNVTITGGTQGVYAYNCRVSASASSVSGATYEGIIIQRDNFSVPITASLSGVSSYGNGRDGIKAVNTPTTVTNSSIYLNGEDGIEFVGYGNGALRLTGSLLTDNAASGAYLYQSYVSGSAEGPYIASNTFLRNSDGLYINVPGGPDTVVTVKGNQSNSNRRWGFVAENAGYPATTSGNTARDNVNEGFVAWGTFSSSSTDRCYGNNNGGAQYYGYWTCTLLSK